MPAVSRWQCLNLKKRRDADPLAASSTYNCNSPHPATKSQVILQLMILKFVWGFHTTLGVTIPTRSAEVALHLKLSCHHKIVPNISHLKLNRHTMELWSTFGCQYDVGIMHGHSKTHFCPFSGGGDIYIMQKNLVSGVVLATIPSTSADPDPTDSPESLVESLKVTPPKAGEHKCGAIENRVQHGQTDREVELQLQANMLLLTSDLWVKKIKANCKMAGEARHCSRIASIHIT